MYNGLIEEYADAPDKSSSRLPLSNQEKAIAELHDTIGQLTSRLKPVLTPVPESERNATDDKAQPVQSPLAEQMQANNYVIYKASNKLHALMERLEC